MRCCRGVWWLPLGVTPATPGAAAPEDHDAVDVHAVALFLFAQVYVRRHHLASQQPALDVWPGGHAASEAAAMDPCSPGRQRPNHTGPHPLPLVTQRVLMHADAHS